MTEKERGQREKMLGRMDMEKQRCQEMPGSSRGPWRRRERLERERARNRNASQKAMQLRPRMKKGRIGLGFRVTVPSSSPNLVIFLSLKCYCYQVGATETLNCFCTPRCHKVEAHARRIFCRPGPSQLQRSRWTRSCPVPGQEYQHMGWPTGCGLDP
jgi:hypothetical protein